MLLSTVQENENTNSSKSLNEKNRDLDKISDIDDT
jgi:hypothetical protein